jgi:hypothetical protein
VTPEAWAEKSQLFLKGRRWKSGDKGVTQQRKMKRNDIVISKEDQHEVAADRLRDSAKLFASWRSGPETLSGFSQRKLRLKGAASDREQTTNERLQERHVAARVAQRIVLRLNEQTDKEGKE